MVTNKVMDIMNTDQIEYPPSSEQTNKRPSVSVGMRASDTRSEALGEHATAVDAPVEPCCFRGPMRVPDKSVVPII